MKKLTLTLAALAVAATGGVAYAEPSISITGMIRQEIANNTGGPTSTHVVLSLNGRLTTNYLANLAPLDPGDGSPSGLCAAGHCVGTTRANVTAEEPD